MALRKEEFHYDPQEHKQMEKDQASKRHRIIIDITPELNERIQAAARQHELTVDQYLEGLLDEVIPEQGATQRSWKPINPEAVEKLRQLQEQILQEHGGKPFESSVELLREAREERDKELGL